MNKNRRAGRLDSGKFLSTRLAFSATCGDFSALVSVAVLTLAPPKVDVESNRLTARASMAERLYGLASRAVGDFLHRGQVAFQRLLGNLITPISENRTNSGGPTRTAR